MKLGIQFRLMAFGGAIVVAALLMGWAAHFTWRKFEALSEKLTPAQIASFQTGDHFRATLQELNAILERFKSSKDLKDWQLFRRQFEELNLWIDQQRLTLRTAPERTILNQIDLAYDSYLEAATNLLVNAQDKQSSALPPEHVQKVQDVSQTLLNLGYQLVDAHRDSLVQFLNETRHSLAVFRRVMFGALFFLLLILSWVGMIVYREMIMPLRMKLVESKKIGASFLDKGRVFLNLKPEVFRRYVIGSPSLWFDDEACFRWEADLPATSSMTLPPCKALPTQPWELTAPGQARWWA